MPDDVVDVEGEHPQAHAELRRGQAGAVLLLHGLDQVGDEPAQLRVEVDDRVGRGTQHRVAEEADGLDGHVPPFGSRGVTAPVYGPPSYPLRPPPVARSLPSSGRTTSRSAPDQR